jgi:hypothetical protein
MEEIKDYKSTDNILFYNNKECMSHEIKLKYERLTNSGYSLYRYMSSFDEFLEFIDTVYKNKDILIGDD